jgi:hypothetical protein
LGKIVSKVEVYLARGALFSVAVKNGKRRPELWSGK